MRKAIFWGFLGTLAEPGAPSPNPLDPGQYRVYPDAAATLALCAYKGYQNYMLAECGMPAHNHPYTHLSFFRPHSSSHKGCQPHFLRSIRTPNAVHCQISLPCNS